MHGCPMSIKRLQSSGFVHCAQAGSLDADVQTFCWILKHKIF